MQIDLLIKDNKMIIFMSMKDGVPIDLTIEVKLLLFNNKKQAKNNNKAK